MAKKKPKKKPKKKVTDIKYARRDRDLDAVDAMDEFLRLAEEFAKGSPPEKPKKV